jgi:hypothetical protein
VQVVPKKLAAYADITNESVGDANAAEIVGQAMAQALAHKVDAAFFTSGGPTRHPSLASATVLTVDASLTAGVDPHIDAMAPKTGFRLEGTERRAVLGRDSRWLDDCTLAHLAD